MNIKLLSSSLFGMFMQAPSTEKFKENLKLTSIKLNIIAWQTLNRIPASKNSFAKTVNAIQFLFFCLVLHVMITQYGPELSLKGKPPNFNL